MIMSVIKEKIEADLKTALRQKAGLSVSVLRLLLSEIHNLEIKKQAALSDSDVQTLLRQSVKRHQDSIEQFSRGGREDLAQKEEAEQKLIESYLPEPLSPDELQVLVKEALLKAASAGRRPTFGEVMKLLMPKVKGRSSGQTISNLVKQELAK